MDAVGTERVSKIVGYLLSKGNFSESSPNLPQRIVILGEANTANQGTLDLAATEITSAQQAGKKYGFGSPIYAAMRIFRPLNGGGIGGIPTVVMPQEEPEDATAKVIEITPTGVATGNGTHTLIIAGRGAIDGQPYALNINNGDTTADITEKIKDAVNAVLGSPVIGDADDYAATLTTKWKGLTANELTISVDTGGEDLGITYAITSPEDGSGTPSIAAALEQFGNTWNTIVINMYGTHAGTMTALEEFNGIPDPANPTGRFSAIIFKPLFALTGSTADDPSDITDDKADDVTIVICPAPGSKGFQFEAAANAGTLLGRQQQDTPHLDISGMSYPDMPTPLSIGSMGDYENRDLFVKKGCSTVELVNSRYRVCDFVTTYHPDGELPPQFRYVRNLNIDFNVRFGYFLKEQINVVDHAIAADEDFVNADKIIKPKQWKGILNKYAEELTARGLLVNAPFMQASITVKLSTINPDRLDSFFRYKRSGFARISSTEAQAGFNFGSIN